MQTALTANPQSAPDYGSCGLQNTPSIAMPKRHSMSGSTHSPSRGVVHLDMMAISAKLNVSQTDLARSLSRSPGEFFPRASGASAGAASRPSSYVVQSTFGGLSVGSHMSDSQFEEAMATTPGSPTGLLAPQVVMIGSPHLNLGARTMSVSKLLQPTPGLSSARLEFEPGPKEDRIVLLVRYAEPIRAWLLLITGLLAWSSTGPLYVFLPDALKVRPFRVAFWRYGFGFIPFFIAFLYNLRAGGLSREHRKLLLSIKSWPIFSALAVTTLGGFTLYGLSVANCEKFALAAGMSALNPFLLLLWQLGCGRAIGNWNWFGLGLAVIGAVGMLIADQLRSVEGTLDGMTSSAFFTAYVAAAEMLSAQLPFTALMSITFGIGAIIAAVLSFIHENTTLSPGPESILGFTDNSYVFTVSMSLTLAYMWGLTGLTASAKDLPALVVAVAIALEPMCSCFIIAFSKNQWPGSLNTVSMIFLIAGSIIVGCAEALREKEEKKIDVTDAALPWDQEYMEAMISDRGFPWSAGVVDLMSKPSPI